MGFLKFALNRIKFTVPCADRAANALRRINIGFLANSIICCHGTGRTDICTCHTSDTLCIVDLRKITDHFKCAKITGLHAGTAPDTGLVALLTQCHTLLRIMTGNSHNVIIRLHAENMLRTNLNTLFTGLTFVFVNNRNALNRINVNGIKRADTDAASETKAGIRTGF